VIGQPVKGVQGDEEIVAFVQLEPGSELSVDELAEYASHQLVPYKRPSKIQFVLTMPLTPTGKVMKDELAKRLASELLPSSSRESRVV
jgi:acyl-coenzyme A synthetase/AMP-(fatty) acid ligase